jgi:uroporphyrinogen III methyltransferase/synthase
MMPGINSSENIRVDLQGLVHSNVPAVIKQNGKVYLVGAGPGDAGLITVRGAECLAASNVVVYDHLANEGLLSHAPADCEKVYVGKTATQHTKTQAEINQLLFEHAASGKIVTRLKGGDPFVFGRGGEEAIFLAERKIQFEIVPGVTSAIAVPAYAGIPVTHRNICTSFHVITGHENPEKDDPDINWRSLAQSDGTLIFLMGVSNIGQISKQLIKHGKDASTPVAMVRWGTLPEQETLTSTLSNIAEDVARANFHAPAVTVVGSVIELRPLVQWYEKKPLFGIRAAITRPAGQSARLAAMLRDAGADLRITPTIRTQPRVLSAPVKQQIESLAEYDWVLFTSVNAVDIFIQFLLESKSDVRALRDARIGAIGEKTCEALKRFGIRADATPRDAAQENLAAAIRIVRGDRVLIPRASAARDALHEVLESRGAKVTVLPIYDTVADKEGIAALRQQLTRGSIHLVTFTSSSTVERFAEAVKDEDLPRLFHDVTIASIGKITSRTITELGLPVHIEAVHATSESLAETIIEHYSKAAAKK